MTQKDRNVSRRASRRATVQPRRGVRFATLGILTIAVTVAVAVVVFALNGSSNKNSGGATVWSTASYTGGPRLAVDRTLVDHGSVAYNHEVRATYRLKNVGDQMLTLQQPSVEVAEGC